MRCFQPIAPGKEWPWDLTTSLSSLAFTTSQSAT